MEQIKALYPKLTDAEVRAKISEADSPFMLLRSLVPLYYQMLSQGAVKAPMPSTASGGWCAGDAHPENFGAILQRDGRALFTLNDVDDAGPCEMWADALRFFASVRLFSDAIDLDPLLNAYRDGVHARAEALSSVSRELLEQAESGGRKVQKKFLNKDGTALLRDKDTSDVSVKERAAIEQALRKNLQGFAGLSDALKVRRDGGGSGGLDRYLALVDLRYHPESGSGKFLLEFKELGQPGIFPLKHGAMPGAARRIPTTLQLEQGKNVSGFFGHVQMLSCDYLLRPRWEGSSKVSDKQITPALLKDEANALGLLHSRGALRLADYRRALDAVPDRFFKDGAREMADRFRDAYKALK